VVSVLLQAAASLHLCVTASAKTVSLVSQNACAMKVVTSAYRLDDPN
jgi:hypothetical protein